MLSGSYEDVMVLNDRSSIDSVYQMKYSEKTKNLIDSRLDLDNTWLKFLKFQPLWKIRNYYGEKIGLYFAWLGKLRFFSLCFYWKN